MRLSALLVRVCAGYGEEAVSTVICMELCDQGSLWAAVCKGTFRSSSASRFGPAPMTVGGGVGGGCLRGDRGGLRHGGGSTCEQAMTHGGVMSHGGPHAPRG